MTANMKCDIIYETISAMADADKMLSFLFLVLVLALGDVVLTMQQIRRMREAVFGRARCGDCNVSSEHVTWIVGI